MWKNYRLTIGLLFWVAVLGCLVVIPYAFSENSWIQSLSRIARYIDSPRQTIQVQFDRELYVKKGDPVYIRTEYGWKRIGQVVSEQVDEDGFEIRVKEVTIALFGDAPPVTRNCFVTLHETPSSFEWALKRLIPPDRRKKILNDLKLKFQEHQQEILEELTPILLDTLREVSLILREDLVNAIRDNRDALEKIGLRYQETFVEKKLIPLVKQEIWPIIERRAQPVLDEVGREVWQKASLWRFGWRLAYDKFPLTNSNLVQQEWNRFVKDDVLPIVENHSADFYGLARNILRDISENAKIREAGRDGIQQLLADQELKDLISRTLWRILFENDRLNEAIRKNLTSERTINALRATNQRFEDKIREIGDQLFGTFERGITKEFAGVLRKEILRRDQRWFILRYNNSKTNDRLEMATTIPGRFDPDDSQRPEFVRYRNDR